MATGRNLRKEFRYIPQNGIRLYGHSSREDDVRHHVNGLMMDVTSDKADIENSASQPSVHKANL